MDNIVKDNAMRQIKFSVPGQPFGKQRPKFSRAGQYVKPSSPDETVSHENLVKLMYQQTAKGRMFKDEDMLDVRVKNIKFPSIIDAIFVKAGVVLNLLSIIPLLCTIVFLISTISRRLFQQSEDIKFRRSIFNAFL